MEKILEPQIKAAFINKFLKSSNTEEKIIINEFNIENSTRRADLVVISKNMIEAFEIKSEADSLARLEGQVAKYSEFFDKVTVILAKKHKSKACDILSEDIGVWEFENDCLKILKKGRKKTIKNKENLIKFMTAIEIKKLLKSIGVKTNIYKRKDLEILLLKQSTALIREAAIKSIKNRYKKRYIDFLEATSGKKISTEDLYLLSQHKRTFPHTNNSSIETLIKNLDFI